MGKLMHVCRWCLFFLINSADFNFFVNECLFWPITHKYMFYYTLKPLTWTKSTDVQSCCCFNCLGFEIIELVRNWFPACGIGPICELQDNSHTGITKFFNKRKKKKNLLHKIVFIFSDFPHEILLNRCRNYIQMKESEKEKSINERVTHNWSSCIGWDNKCVV